MAISRALAGIAADDVRPIAVEGLLAGVAATTTATTTIAAEAVRGHAERLLLGPCLSSHRFNRPDAPGSEAVTPPPLRSLAAQRPCWV